MKVIDISCPNGHYKTLSIDEFSEEYNIDIEFVDSCLLGKFPELLDCPDCLKSNGHRYFKEEIFTSKKYTCTCGFTYYQNDTELPRKSCPNTHASIEEWEKFNNNEI